MWYFCSALVFVCFNAKTEITQNEVYNIACFFQFLLDWTSRIFPHQSFRAYPCFVLVTGSFIKFHTSFMYWPLALIYLFAKENLFLFPHCFQIYSSFVLECLLFQINNLPITLVFFLFHFDLCKFISILKVLDYSIDIKCASN